MSRDERLLFKLGKHAVMMWPDYGVVCPSKWTTNGSVRMVAQQAYYLLKHWKEDFRKEGFTPDDRYDLNESIIPESAFESEEKLYEAIKAEWVKFDTETRKRRYQSIRSQMLLEVAGMLGQ